MNTTTNLKPALNSIDPAEIIKAAMQEEISRGLTSWLGGADPNEFRPVPGFQAEVNAAGRVRRLTGSGEIAKPRGDAQVSVAAANGIWHTLPATALVAMAFGEFWAGVEDLATVERPRRRNARASTPPPGEP
jgi:hypothetical protein